MSSDVFQQSGSSPTPDVLVENHFSLILFRLLSPATKQWVDQNVSEDAQFFGGALEVEPRYATDLISGLVADGLEVRS
jgi:hypothetical protein